MNVSIEIAPNMTLAEFEVGCRRQYLLAILQRASGSMSKAAKLADVNRQHFSELVANAGLTTWAEGLRQSAYDLKIELNKRYGAHVRGQG